MLSVPLFTGYFLGILLYNVKFVTNKLRSCYGLRGSIYKQIVNIYD